MTSRNPAAIKPRDRSAAAEHQREEELHALWRRMRRQGRHGFAARRTALVAGGALLILGLRRGAGLFGVHVVWPSADALLWGLVLGVPLLGALYRVLLARYDQEAVHYGETTRSRVSLSDWRQTNEAASAIDADGDDAV